jgi:hypothetical protein
MTWVLSPAKSVQQTVRNVKTYLKTSLEEWYSLPKWGENPFPVDYTPKEDVTLLLEPKVDTYYVQFIGILGWMWELGQIDICTEVSMSSLYSAMPLDGHLEAAIHVFSYFKSNSNSQLSLTQWSPMWESLTLWSVTGLNSTWVWVRLCHIIPQSALARCDSTNVRRQWSPACQGESMLKNGLCHLPQLWNDWLAFEDTVDNWDLRVWHPVLQWNLALRTFVAPATISVWWECSPSYVYCDNMSLLSMWASQSQCWRRSLTRSATMQYVRLLQWARPLLPTSQQRRTLLISSPMCCIGRHKELFSTGCSGMCSPEKMSLQSWVARVQLMTGPCHPGPKDIDWSDYYLFWFPGHILPRLPWWDLANLGGTDKMM